MNILEALEATAPSSGGRKCKIQRWLDDIPADQPHREDLIATMVTTDPMSPHYRTLDQLDAITHHLGFNTSTKTITDHRARRCRCHH